MTLPMASQRIQAEGEDVSTKEREDMLEELYREMFPKLVRLAGTTGLNREDARDITQKVFVIALVRIEELEKGENRQGWLTLVLKNLLQNNQRSRSKAPQTAPLLEEFDPDSGQSRGYVASSEDTYAFEWEDLFVREVGKEAYELQQDVYRIGLTDAELEAKYGIKAANCRNRASRTKKKMEKVLKKYF